MQYQKTGEIKHRTIEENNIVSMLFGIVSAVIYWLFPDSEFNFFTPKNKARKRIRKAAIWIFGIIIILTRL